MADDKGLVRVSARETDPAKAKAKTAKPMVKQGFKGKKSLNQKPKGLKGGR